MPNGITDLEKLERSTRETTVIWWAFSALKERFDTLRRLHVMNPATGKEFSDFDEYRDSNFDKPEKEILWSRAYYVVNCPENEGMRQDFREICGYFCSSHKAACEAHVIWQGLYDTAMENEFMYM